MKLLAKIFLVLLMLVPLAVTSTPPMIFWFIFDVEGSVERLGGSLANHTVQLYGTCAGSFDWVPLGTCNGEGAEDYGPFTRVALTNEEGEFHVRVSACGPFPGVCDSLVIAVIYPDTTVFGAPFAYDSVSPSVIEKTGTTVEEDTGLFDCAGEHEYTYEDGYIYTYPFQTIPVP